MLDIKIIRDDPEYVKDAMRRLFEPAEMIDEIVELDEQWRNTLTQVEELRAERNARSKEIGRTKDSDERQRKIEEVREVNAQIDELEPKLQELEDELNRKMLRVPNIPHESVPVSPDEADNPVIKEWGERREFDFAPKPHWDLGEELGIIDFERGTKVAGSRFFMMKGIGSRLNRALIQWMLDFHIDEHGYSEVYPPFMVRSHALVGTGNLPKFGDVLFRDAEEDYWWIPTAEVPITNMYREEILDGNLLPIRHVSYTPCFRREKMSAGREVRGIKRLYQFDKVEMVKFVEPETSMDELESLIRNAEEVAEALELPYRRVQMVTGDLSFVAAVKYDVEMWAPGMEEWLEVSSCSNFMDFQARRANIRYRPEPAAKPEYVHTLNGSGLALPRTIIAIMENYQQEDGSIVIPEVLRPYMRGIDRITPDNALRGAEIPT